MDSLIVMALSSTKVGMLLYGTGLVAPVVLVGLGKLLERSRDGASNNMGIAWVVLVSLAVCVTGALIWKATLKTKLLLVLLAVVVIPVELIVLAAILLKIGGLSGTQ